MGRTRCGRIHESWELKTASGYKGSALCVNIPMLGTIESLNLDLDAIVAYLKSTISIKHKVSGVVNVGEKDQKLFVYRRGCRK